MESYLQEYLSSINSRLQSVKQLEAKYLESNYIDIGITSLSNQIKTLSDRAGDIEFAKFLFFLVWVLLLCLLRTMLLQIMVRFGRCDYAEKNRIIKKPAMTSKQMERESNSWKFAMCYDTLFLLGCYYFNLFREMPLIDLSSIFIMFFIHCSLVEFVYYWIHRVFHSNKLLFENVHRYHHKSVHVTPMTAFTVEVLERPFNTLLFCLSPAISCYFGFQSFIALSFYFLWFDFMNEAGHLNFELSSPPQWLFFSPNSFFASKSSSSPSSSSSFFTSFSSFVFGFFSFFKFVVYSPTYHAIHHLKRTNNFALFMPWTDVLFGTASFDKDNCTQSNDSSIDSSSLLPTHYRSQKTKERPAVTIEKPKDFILLVHGGYTPSMLYSPIVHSYLPKMLQQNNLYEHKPWMYLLYPLMYPYSLYLSYFSKKGHHTEDSFDVFPLTTNNNNNHNTINDENMNNRNNKENFEKKEEGEEWNANKSVFHGETVSVRNFAANYILPSFKKIIVNRIENAILDANRKGVRVVVLGNFNKAEWINHGGTDIVNNLKGKLNGTYISHGDTLSAATVYQYALELHRLGYWPNRRVFVTGSTSKIGRAVCLSLAKRGFDVYMFTQCRPRFDEIAAEADGDPAQRSRLHFSTRLSDGAECDLWLTGKMIPQGRELLCAIPQNATVVNFSVPDPLHSSDFLKSRPDILHLDTGLLSFDQKIMDPTFTWLLPKGLIYACLGGGIIHSVLGLQEHEVGPVEIEKMDLYWNAATKIGFRIPPPTSFYTPITLPPPKPRFSSVHTSQTMPTLPIQVV